MAKRIFKKKGRKVPLRNRTRKRIAQIKSALKGKRGIKSKTLSKGERKKIKRALRLVEWTGAAKKMGKIMKQQSPILIKKRGKLTIDLRDGHITPIEYLNGISNLYADWIYNIARGIGVSEHKARLLKKIHRMRADAAIVFPTCESTGVAVKRSDFLDILDHGRGFTRRLRRTASPEKFRETEKSHLFVDFGIQEIRLNKTMPDIRTVSPDEIVLDSSDIQLMRVPIKAIDIETKLLLGGEKGSMIHVASRIFLDIWRAGDSYYKEMLRQEGRPES